MENHFRDERKFPIKKRIIMAVIKKGLLSLMLLYSTVLLTGSSAIDDYLRQVYREHVIPGFSIVVVEEGKVIFSKAYGVEVLGEPAPMTIRSVLGVGSLTKSVTAMAMMQLVEAGKVRLDDPVVKYLPWFRTANKERSDRITVRMLLDNTSGIPSNFSVGKSGDLTDAAAERLVRAMQSIYLTKEPGTSYEYSNNAFVVAGLIISEVSGLAYADYLRENIFEPLNMRRTSTDPRRFAELNVLSGHYAGINGGILPRPEIYSGEYYAAGSHLQSCAADMAHYLIAMLNGGAYQGKQVLRPESIARLWEPQVAFPGLPIEDGGDGSDFHYGLGWMINDIGGITYVHHGGSTGRTSSFTMLDPKRRLGVSLLMNLDLTFIDKFQYATEWRIAHNVLRLAQGKGLSDYGIPKRKDPTVNNFSLPASELKIYEGEYLYGSGTNKHLHGTRLEVVGNADGRLEGRVMHGGQIMSHFLFDFVNEQSAVTRNVSQAQPVRFELQPDGKVTGVSLFGVNFIRPSASFYNRYQQRVSEDRQIQFYLPKDWQGKWETTRRFTADKEASSLIADFSPVAEENIHLLFGRERPGHEIIHEGLIHNEVLGQAIWKEQSLISRKDGDLYQHLVVVAGGGEACRLVLTTPQGMLTPAVQEVVATLMDTLVKNR